MHYPRKGLFDLRKAKLEEIEKLGQAAYPNQFAFSHTIPEVRQRWGDRILAAVPAGTGGRRESRTL